MGKHKTCQWCTQNNEDTINVTLVHATTFWPYSIWWGCSRDWMPSLVKGGKTGGINGLEK